MSKVNSRIKVSLEVNFEDFQFSNIKFGITSKNWSVVSTFRAHKPKTKVNVAHKATLYFFLINIKGVAPRFLTESWSQIVCTFYTHRCTRSWIYLDWMTPWRINQWKQETLAVQYDFKRFSWSKEKKTWLIFCYTKGTNFREWCFLAGVCDTHVSHFWHIFVCWTATVCCPSMLLVNNDER